MSEVKDLFEDEIETENSADAEADAETLDVDTETSIFLSEGEEESETFLPEASEEEVEEETSEAEVSLEGTELDGFESAEIEEVEFVEEERLESIIESVLFASDRPTSLASLKLLFKGTNVRGDKIRRALDQLAVEYAGGRRGVTLEEVPGGYQLRTKIDNMEFLKRTLKARQFKLSGPALEVLAIVAYKQPMVKSEVDEIRGVESGHLLRALMEKNLVCFEGKSELPGRPMQYGTTKKFLEIFGLRTLKELPTLSQIDELLPEGIDEQQAEEKPTLAMITDSMSESFLGNYSVGEDELMKIEEQLGDIATSTNFFEEEKRRQAEKRDEEKAQNIREAMAMDEPVSTRDENWMKKYDEAIAAGTTLVAIAALKAEERKANAFKKKPVVSDEQSEAASSEEMTDEEQLEGELLAAEASDEYSDEDADDETAAESDETDMEMADSEEGSDEQETEENDELHEAIANFDNDEDMEVASDDSLFSAEDDSDEDEELPFLGEADDIDEEGNANT